MKKEFHCEECGYQPLVTWREFLWDVLTDPLTTFAFGIALGGFVAIDSFTMALAAVDKLVVCK